MSDRLLQRENISSGQLEKPTNLRLVPEVPGLYYRDVEPKRVADTVRLQRVHEELSQETSDFANRSLSLQADQPSRLRFEDPSHRT